jgi:ADP-heptose:LPS heptosyltransferase
MTHDRAQGEALAPAAGIGAQLSRCYVPSRREHLQAFREGLALRFSHKKVLIAGPYAGEFGHEIMDFQSYVRWLKRKYDTVHVITFPGREALYRGCVVHRHDYDLTAVGYLYGRITYRQIRQHALDFAHQHGLQSYDLFSTAHLGTRWHRRLLFREEHEVFKPLGPVTPNGKILFHFRSIAKLGPDTTRNFRPELAEAVCRSCQSHGLDIACIGHPQYSLCPTGCEDCRTENLEETISHIAGCRFIVGELSGPMHLAAYCAKPIVIWVPEASRLTNAFKRNPFNVKVVVVRDDTTNPAPEEIVGRILSAAELTP